MKPDDECVFNNPKLILKICILILYLNVNIIGQKHNLVYFIFNGILVCWDEPPYNFYTWSLLIYENGGLLRN